MTTPSNGQAAYFKELSAELEYLRMTRDWTYGQLSARIAAVTRRRRADDCWRRFCLGLTKHPHERTVNILETFLASERVRGARRRPVRRAS